jgi:hypothetical protein
MAAVLRSLLHGITARWFNIVVRLIGEINIQKGKTRMTRLKTAHVAALLVVLVVAAGCGIPGLGGLIGSRTLVTQEYDFSDFTAVEAGGAFTVNISQGDEYSVVVTANENVVDYLRVEQNGDTLTLGTDRLWNFSNVTLEAEITMPELHGVNLSGASEGEITGFSSGDDFSVQLSGASSLRGDITSGDADMEGSGASRIELTGAGGNLRLDLSGASNADLSDFPVQDADIRASGASDAAVNVSGRLDADASGASSVGYTGDPELGRIESSGASDVGAD